MATHFDRWEKDPFFSAAEDVQESADRMESTYRTWLHSQKDTSGVWNVNELRRDLQTALGTTKWQLQEFERAVTSSYKSSSADDSTHRHRDFISVTESHISKAEKSLNESAILQGKPPLPWVCLDEAECNELALFLSRTSTAFSVDQSFGRVLNRDQQAVSSIEADKQQAMAESSEDLFHSLERRRVGAEEKLTGHCRTASTSDIGVWKITVSDDVFPPHSSNEQPEPPPRKFPSSSGFLDTTEFATKLNWSKNGYRKLKLSDRNQEADILHHSQNLTIGFNACYQRSNSCLDDCYDKQLYGGCGAFQRLLQRYRVQYSRPVQAIFSVILLFSAIVLLAACAI